MMDLLRTKNIPLYGPSGSPQLEDIQQLLTGDCWLEAVLAAIIHIDLVVIVNRLFDEGDGHVKVVFNNEEGSDISVTVKKKTRHSSVLDQNA